jgi:hypothetical protein
MFLLGFLGLAYSHVRLIPTWWSCRMAMPRAVSFSTKCAQWHHAGYLYTVGSKSLGCVKGSGRAVVGTLLSHIVPGHCGRCTEYRSRCSMFLLLQSTLLQEHGRWKECWALVSAPQSHLGNDIKSKCKTLFIYNLPTPETPGALCFRGEKTQIVWRVSHPILIKRIMKRRKIFHA